MKIKSHLKRCVTVFNLVLKESNLCDALSDLVTRSVNKEWYINNYEIHNYQRFLSAGLAVV